MAEKAMTERAAEKVVFLDRDGTINEEVSYLHKPEDLRILPGVVKGLSALKAAGFKLIVVTNQAGVARGYYSEADVAALHRYMNGILEAEGAGIDGFYYCPHHPVHGIGAYKVSCDCRKPGTGMFRAAVRDMELKGMRLDREHSYMIGDKLLDTEAGRNFGLTSVLVGTGYGAELYARVLEEGGEPVFDRYEEDLEKAAGWIMGREKRHG